MKARSWTSPNSRNTVRTGMSTADRRPERGARGGPEDVRVRERVAEDALERRSGDGQPEPDDHRREDARQPQVDDDRLGRRRPRPAEVEPEQPMGEDRHRVARGHGHRPEPDREDEHDEECDDGAGDEHPGPRPGALEPARVGQRRAEDVGPGGHGGQ